MQNENTTIDNAEAIIERFGGIRPMASKISVPVTTVQGWKKRNAIPANRLEQIVQAAKDHNINISDILEVGSAPVANENRQKTAAVAAAAANAPEAAKFGDELQRIGFGGKGVGTPKPASGPMPGVVYEDIVKKVSEAEGNALFKSAIINAILIVIATGAVVLLLWPQANIRQNLNGRRIEALETNVSTLQGTVNGFKNSLSQVVPSIQNQAQMTGQEIGNQVKQIAHDTVGPNAGSLNQRIISLQGHVNQLLNAPEVAALASTLQGGFGAGGAPEQAPQYGQAWTALVPLVLGAQDAVIGSVLMNAAQQIPEVKQAMAGVPPQDMRMAAAVLGMSHVESALGQDNQPFGQDVQAVKALLGPQADPGFTSALDSIAGAGQTGVLTPKSLDAAFAPASQSAVSASLANGSLADHAQANLNNVVQVQKDGQLITGTPTQGVIAQAQASLEHDDIQGAINAMQTLQGPAAQAAAPWIADAQATLKAQQVKQMLADTLSTAPAPGQMGPITTPGAAPATAPQQNPQPGAQQPAQQ